MPAVDVLVIDDAPAAEFAEVEEVQQWAGFLLWPYAGLPNEVIYNDHEDLILMIDKFWQLEVVSLQLCAVFFASSSAFSLPSTPLWPNIH
jgi:hypothetical protein